jgi:hypothetical protein
MPTSVGTTNNLKPMSIIPTTKSSANFDQPVLMTRRRFRLSSSTPKLVWKRLDFPLLPPPRIEFAVTQNSMDKTALLFGGFNSTIGQLNDLWSTDGHVWSQLPPHGGLQPLDRSGPSLIYDEARQETILFGGVHNYEYLGNTWKYVPNRWLQQFPQTSPPPRAFASMAYDAERNITILFGGFYSIETDDYALNDMWTWDGMNWQQQFPATLPPARFGANMVFDRARQNIVLFGGGTLGGLLDDTWIWDGLTWIEKHPLHSPGGRADFGMAYDEGRQQVLLFGGQTDRDSATDTWSWDGQDWIQLHTYYKPPIDIAYGVKLVYLPDLQTVVLFGDFRQKLCSKNESDCFSEKFQVWALTDQYLTYLPLI